MKPSVIASLVCLFGVATTAVADSWSCNKADLIRHVVVYYRDAPARLPCEVFYSKPREGVVPRALWGAANSEGYCERKAAEFVSRLEAWGWSCVLDEADAETRSTADPSLPPAQASPP